MSEDIGFYRCLHEDRKTKVFLFFRALKVKSKTLQFLSAHKKTSGPPAGIVFWADLTKFGRLATCDLNFVVTSLATCLAKSPANAIGFVLAPHLVSEKVAGGHRGEIRTLGWHCFAPEFLEGGIFLLILHNLYLELQEPQKSDVLNEEPISAIVQVRYGFRTV